MDLNKKKGLVKALIMRLIHVVIGGVLALTVAMGMGRFAYTPILPIMEASAGLSVEQGGYLASSNYLGYLIGSLMVGIIPKNWDKVIFLRVSLIFTVFVLAGMGMTWDYHLWLLFRLLSGVFSGIIFVVSSSIVLDVLVKNQKSLWSGFFYSGVGLGIFMTSIIVPFFNLFFGWQGAWIGIALVSLILILFPLIWLGEEKQAQKSEREVQLPISQISEGHLYPYLLVAYGLEGLGYIISATFLVAMVQQMPQFHLFSSLSWMMVGLAAIPSSLFWMFIATKKGYMPIIITAYILQAIGVVLPVLSHHALLVLMGAFLFGVTFMGITTMMTTLVRMIGSDQSAKSIGYLTTVYGIGQILGPVIAGYSVSLTGTFDFALRFGSIIIFLGAVFLWLGRKSLLSVQNMKRKEEEECPM